MEMGGLRILTNSRTKNWMLNKTRNPILNCEEAAAVHAVYAINSSPEHRKDRLFSALSSTKGLLQSKPTCLILGKIVSR